MNKKNKHYLITWKNKNNPGNPKGQTTCMGVGQLEQQLTNLQTNIAVRKVRVNVLKKGKTYRVKRLKHFELTETK